MPSARLKRPPRCVRSATISGTIMPITAALMPSSHCTAEHDRHRAGGGEDQRAQRQRGEPQHQDRAAPVALGAGAEPGREHGRQQLRHQHRRGGDQVRAGAAERREPAGGERQQAGVAELEQGDRAEQGDHPAVAQQAAAATAAARGAPGGGAAVWWSVRAGAVARSSARMRYRATRATTPNAAATSNTARVGEPRADQRRAAPAPPAAPIAA